MKLRALNDAILFKFTDDSSGGFFASKLSSTIVIAQDAMDNQSGPRWGIVVAAGPDVGPEIQEGKYILIDSLKWTTGMRLQQSDPKSTIWKTTYENVSAVSDELVTPY